MTLDRLALLLRLGLVLGRWHVRLLGFGLVLRGIGLYVFDLGLSHGDVFCLCDAGMI